jgi:hypothetical protein
MNDALKTCAQHTFVSTSLPAQALCAEHKFASTIFLVLSTRLPAQAFLCCAQVILSHLWRAQVNH